MEAENIEQVLVPKESTPLKHDKTFVYTIRDWKEYLGESFLIIFSVLLALIFTEYFNKLHEKENTKELLKSISAELNHNQKAIQEVQVYDTQVLKKIDAALSDPQLQNALVSNNEFHLDVIAPQGAQYRTLDNEAWTIAKNNNIMSKIDFESVSTLTKVYDDQAKMNKVDDELAKIIFDRSSRDPKQVKTTLILIRDVYHAWAMDRASGLLTQIETAIKKIHAE